MVNTATIYVFVICPKSNELTCIYKTNIQIHMKNQLSCLTCHKKCNLYSYTEVPQTQEAQS